MMNEYIDREAVNSALGDACKECLDGCEEFDGIYPDCNYCLLHGAIERIIAIPAADVAPVKHGHWIGVDYDGYADGNPVYTLFECSKCGIEYEQEERYCPNCGARMDGDNERAE